MKERGPIHFVPIFIRLVCISKVLTNESAIIIVPIIFRIKPILTSVKYPFIISIKLPTLIYNLSERINFIFPSYYTPPNVDHAPANSSYRVKPISYHGL